VKTCPRDLKMMRALRANQGEQTYVQKSDDWSRKYVTQKRLLNNNSIVYHSNFHLNKLGLSTA
jgi:hypothetical protein